MDVPYSQNQNIKDAVGNAFQYVRTMCRYYVQKAKRFDKNKQKLSKLSNNRAITAG